MQAFLNTAIEAARKAGDIAQMNFGRINESDIKTKSYNEFVTFVDKQAEAAIKEIIQSRYPDHGMIAEESGENTNNKQDFVWIVDPIDGTTNYIHSFPVYAVSIALQIKGVLEVGVIYDPSRQELFTALKGQGSRLDERRIRVSKQSTLEGALLGTGFPYRQKKDWLDIYLEIFSEFSQKAAGIRRPGAAALDLAYIASGRLDGFWEFGLNPWDIAAGVLLIQESGGLCENLIPDQDMIASGNLFAGNPKVFDQMKQIISKYGPQLTQLS